MSTIGYSITRLLSSITDEEVLLFIPPNVQGLLNAILEPGKENTMDIREVVVSITDFSALFESPKKRADVVGLLPREKQIELSDRITCDIDELINTISSDLSHAKISEFKAFFGLQEEQIYLNELTPCESIAPNYSLFSHQLKAVEGMRPALNEGSGRTILHFPTGVGKTRTAMHLICETLNRENPALVIWLASGKELLEQAAAAFTEAWENLGNRPLNLYKLWGSASLPFAEMNDGLLVIGLEKAWSQYRSDTDWAQKLSKNTRLVVFDEAHQSIAPTYKKLTEDLLFTSPTSLLGLSATPGRTWADIDEDRELSAMFQYSKIGLEIEGTNNPIEHLITHEYLSLPRFKTLYSQPGLLLSENDRKQISLSLDIPEDVLNDLSLSEQYVTAVLDAVQSLVEEGHNRILVFAASVLHSNLLAGLLVAKGLRSKSVTGITSKQKRTRSIQDFKSSSEPAQILVNYGVLTTGFDAPKASAVVIARHTQSLVLYSQMVGRAIRGPKAGGTKECTIVTVVDPTLHGFGDLAEAFSNWEDVWN